MKVYRSPVPPRARHRHRRDRHALHRGDGHAGCAHRRIDGNRAGRADIAQSVRHLNRKGPGRCRRARHCARRGVQAQTRRQRTDDRVRVRRSPPVTVIGPLLKATPTVPVLLAAQVTDSAGLILIAQPCRRRRWHPSPCTVKGPGLVGVPVISPVRGSGSAPPAVCRYRSSRCTVRPTRDRHRPAVKGTPTSPVLIAEQVTDSGPD